MVVTHVTSIPATATGGRRVPMLQTQRRVQSFSQRQTAMQLGRDTGCWPLSLRLLTGEGLSSQVCLGPSTYRRIFRTPAPRFPSRHPVLHMHELIQSSSPSVESALLPGPFCRCGQRDRERRQHLQGLSPGDSGTQSEVHPHRGSPVGGMWSHPEALKTQRCLDAPTLRF